MTNLIIDPSTLSEEQRKGIKIFFDAVNEMIKEPLSLECGILIGAANCLKVVFGPEFFKKGE